MLLGWEPDLGPWVVNCPPRSSDSGVVGGPPEENVGLKPTTFACILTDFNPRSPLKQLIT